MANIRAILRNHWLNIAFVVIYPILLLPVFLIENKVSLRLLYVFLVMLGYWISDVIPYPVISFIPIFIFPLMSIMGSKKVSQVYMQETNMLYLSAILIGLGIEYSNLHKRSSLKIMKSIGGSPLRLQFGILLAATVVSMWLNNIAATNMMVLIIEPILAELEAQNCVKTYDVTRTDEGEEIKTPTSITTCYYLSAAYGSTIGGLFTFVGTGANMISVGIIDAIFPKGKMITFVTWLWFSVPVMTLIFIFTIPVLQFAYLGLFRPKSKDAEAIQDKQKFTEVASGVIAKKLEEMGPLSFSETVTGILFIIVVILWSTRTFVFFPGWGALFTEKEVEDSAATMAIVILYFILPLRSTFIYMFSKDETKRPKRASPSLLPWGWAQKRIPWGLILTIGAGYAIAEAMLITGLGTTIGEKTEFLENLSSFVVMGLLTIITVFLTQLMKNSIVALLVVPVALFIAVEHKIHPLYYTMPLAISSSFGWCLSLSTPPNRIVREHANLKEWSMFKTGFYLCIISTAILVALFPLLSIPFGMGEFPKWAEQETLTTAVTEAPPPPPDAPPGPAPAPAPAPGDT